MNKSLFKNLVFTWIFLLLSTSYYQKSYAEEACPVDEAGVSCLKYSAWESDCGQPIFGTGGTERLTEYSCNDGLLTCCFNPQACPNNDPRFKKGTSTACPLYFITFINGIHKTIYYNFQNRELCCYNNKTACSGDFTCIESGACTGTGRYRNDWFCPRDGDVCCKTNTASCECSSSGGKCSITNPDPEGNTYQRDTSLSCDDATCLGDDGGVCWVPAANTCGRIGLLCCPAPDKCSEGVVYEPNMGQCQCLGSAFPRPKPMLYAGPIIDSLDKIINPILKILYYGGLFIGFFFIVLAGYSLMTSQGDPQKAKEAQEQLTSAVIGIIFILLSVNILRVIIQLITTSLGSGS